MTNNLTRRKFLKIGAGSVAAVLAGCQTSHRWVNLEPYVRPPEEQLAGVATWYASTCRQCPAGCGIIVRIMNGRALKIEGNPEHPLNRGKLCARGQAGLQLLYNPDRLPTPVQSAERGSREFRPLTWEAALNTLYEQVSAAGENLAVWGGSTMSGHLYDLFQRFTGALGAPDPLIYDLYAGFNGYHALRQSSQELFGVSALPAYDLADADVILSFGGDFLGAWLSAVRYGVAFGNFRDRPLGKRGYLIQLEPRMSMTGAVSDRWLPVRPGSEALVAAALVRLLADQGLGAPERGERASALAGDIDLAQVADASGLPIAELRDLARVFATAERPVAVPGSPLTGQAEASDALAAVQALNLIAGAGTGPAGLLLAPAPAPTGFVRPPVSALSDVQDLLKRMRDGAVSVLLIHGTNPVFELPPTSEIVAALQQVPFVVSFASIIDETAMWSDVILPDRTYLEAWGYEVVSPDFGMPIVTSQQPVVPSLVDARATADVLLALSRGFPAAAQALPWNDEVRFLQERVAQLPPAAWDGTGAEVLWARFLQHGGWWPSASPRELSLPGEAAAPTPVAVPAFQFSASEYPYFLHLYLSDLLSDGRGASQPWLQGSPDPMTTIAWQTWVELHPDTAGQLGVADGDIVQVRSPHGTLEAPAYLYPAIRPDTVGIPIGQGHLAYGRYARDRGANPLQLLGTETDTGGSGLAWASMRVSVARTGGRNPLALFESKTGVMEGFINQDLPGL